jgi:hypothetical protein
VNEEAEDLNKDIQMVISNLNKTFDDNQNETNEDYKQDQELLVLLMKKIE